MDDAHSTCFLLEHEIVLITQDITTERRRWLRYGMLDAVIDLHPHLEARVAIEVPGRHVDGLEHAAPADA
ncbi:MAG: hypothetical protein ACFB3T_00200 [Geminicoccaceae bacterium]